MNLRKTENLEKLCEQLYELPPKWDEIISRFKSNPKFDPNRAFNLPRYAGYFSEIDLDVRLEELAKRHPDLNISLDLIRKEETENYKFDLTSGRLTVCSKSNPDVTLCEYDKLLLMDDLPVVFEIKIRKWESGRKNKYFVNFFKPERYQKKLDPIHEFYNCDVGYVLILPKDMFEARLNSKHPDSLYNQFKKDNGLIVPFYTNRYEFKNDVLRKVIENKLKLRIF